MEPGVKTQATPRTADEAIGMLAETSRNFFRGRRDRRPFLLRWLLMVGVPVQQADALADAVLRRLAE
jgi:hypothetical protein